MKKNLLYIIAVLSVLVSCTEEKMEVGTPLTGQDVKFSVSMGNNARTVYGDEETDTEGNKSIKVNWVNGDKITVFGTTCSVQQADYSVVANTATQNYADDLVKTGAAGVQWGSEPSDFYAIYPAVEDAIEVDGGVVYINTSVRQYQNNDFVFNETTNTWVGTPYVEGSTTSTMPDALMYACTPNVSSTDNNGVVDLNFKPFSTVLKFTLDGWTVHNDMTDEVGSDAVAYVSKITVKAPEPVTGQCVFKMVGSSVSEVEGGEFEDIVIYPKSLPLMQGQKLEFSAFAIPTTYMMNSTNKPWIVEIETTNFGVHTYHIQPTVPQELVAGEIHKVKIPAIEVNRGEAQLPESKWLRYIPRNVYLSELSMPGAWYCVDKSYQGSDVTIQKLFDVGVRAFNIDCRITRNNFETLMGEKDPWEDAHYAQGKYHFACSGTEKPTNWSIPFVGGYIGMDEGTHVLAAVKEIINIAKANPHEIVAIIFTFAEKPCTEKVNKVLKFGTTNPEFISAELKKVLEDSNVAPYIYKNVTPETTISDLLTIPNGAQYPQNVLVKINHSNKEFYSNYSMPEGIMVSYASMALESEGWGSSYINSISALDENYYSKMQQYDIYNGGGNSVVNTKTNGMTYYYCQAQKSFYSNSGTPTIDERKKAINDVLAKAKSVYDLSHHNALFQLGIGGMVDGGNQSALATNETYGLNTYVNGKINAMLQNPDAISPLGFVLMNYCLNSTDFIKNIIRFNAKFHLNRNDELPEWPAEMGGNPYLEEGEDNGDF